VEKLIVIALICNKVSTYRPNVKDWSEGGWARIAANGYPALAATFFAKE
jgi:hypothetical protein